MKYCTRSELYISKEQYLALTVSVLSQVVPPFVQLGGAGNIAMVNVFL